MKVKISLLIIIVVAAIVLAILATVFTKLNWPFSSKQGGELEISKEIYSISGTIEEIGQNTLIVNALILLENPSNEPVEEKVNVLLDENTKISKLEFPNPDQLPKNTKSINPKETEIKLSDLKVGDKINVQTAANISDNIKNHTDFTAKNITVVE